MKRTVGLTLLSLLTTLFTVSTVAFAQAELSPQSIIINPEPAYGVEVFVDKDPSGNRTPSYQIGERIRVSARVTEDAYVYLFNVRANGDVIQFFPNTYQQDSYVRSGQTLTVPGDNARYSLSVDGPEGTDKVIAVASERRLNTSELARFESGAALATSNLGEQGFAQSLSIIVEPLPQDSWVTDTVSFRVGRGAPPAPALGTLNLRSNPSGARAYVGGEYVGRTPVNYEVRSGRHEVRIDRDGYDSFVTTVEVRGGGSQSVNASLSPIRQTGSVRFESTPSGADVYLGGQRIASADGRTVTLDVGRHEARFVRRGYDAAFVTFTVSAGQTRTVRGNLRAQSGALFIRANIGGAAVFINGDRYGTIPNGSGELTLNDLPAGRHELTITATGYNTFVQEFTIRSGETTSVRASLSRR